MTLNVLLVVTFSLLPFPWNDLDDLWTKSVESLGWYNPLWRWPSFIQARTGDLLPHMSRCDLEFHWTRLPYEEAVRAGWVLRAGEVGWLMRHRAQWLLTLRLTPRCSSGRKGVCMYVCVYICIYIHIHIYIYVYMYTCIHVYVYMYIWGSAGYSPLAGTDFSLQGLLTVEPGLWSTGSWWCLRGLVSHNMWDLLKPSSSATLTSYVRTRGWGIWGGCLLLVFSWERRGSQLNVKTPTFPHGTSTKLHINVFSFSRQH